MNGSGNVSNMTLPAIKGWEGTRSPSEVTPMNTNKKFYRVSDNSDPMSLSPKMVTQLRLKVKPEDENKEEKSSTHGMNEAQKFQHNRQRNHDFKLQEEQRAKEMKRRNIE